MLSLFEKALNRISPIGIGEFRIRGDNIGLTLFLRVVDTFVGDWTMPGLEGSRPEAGID
jgi:hypothetical protein